MPLQGSPLEASETKGYDPSSTAEKKDVATKETAHTASPKIEDGKTDKKRLSEKEAKTEEGSDQSKVTARLGKRPLRAGDTSSVDASRSPAGRES